MSTVNYTLQQDLFLKAYAKRGIIREGLEAAGIDRALLRQWEEDEDFQARMADAREDAVDSAEGELVRRAVEGNVNILFHAGAPIWMRDPATGEVLLDDDFNPIPYCEREYSDSLLALYLKANRRKYGDKSSVELSGPGGSPLNIVTTYVLPDGKTEEDYGPTSSGDRAQD